MSTDPLFNGAQVFPLQQGKLNLTDGDGTDLTCSLIFCVSDGSFIITWPDSDTDTIAMTEGQVFSIHPKCTISLADTLGTFHIA